MNKPEIRIIADTDIYTVPPWSKTVEVLIVGGSGAGGGAGHRGTEVEVLIGAGGGGGCAKLQAGGK